MSKSKRYEREFYQVIADGIPWTDADGNECWERMEADTLATLVENQGYDVEVVPA